MPATTGWGWWSADISATNGQAIVTRRVVSLLNNYGAHSYSYRPGGLRAITSWLFAIMRLWLGFLSGRFRSLYIVCSRSNAGFVRDVPAYLLSFFGVRLLVHVHGSDIVEMCRRPWIGPAARLFLSRASLILPSSHLEAPLRGLGVRNLFTCENFFESVIHPSADLERSACSPVPGLIVLWNSNIMASKGFFVVAEAVRDLVRQGNAIRFRVVGQCIGDQLVSLADCEAALAELLSEEWFEYLGAVTRERALELVKEADVVCLPSRAECQPLALIEAMCAGCRIVITDIPALRCTVGDYPAATVPAPPTIAAISAALLDVANTGHQAPKMTAASVKARQRFSLGRFDQEILGILELHS